MTESPSKTSAQQLAEVQSLLPPDQALSWFPVLLSQVSELHRAGRLHGCIAAAGITSDGNGQPLLGPPADSVVLRGGAPEGCPPELPGERTWTLPSDLKAARGVLTASGVEVDPRRIDIYQLGVLLCSVVSKQPASVYLRSPKARGQVPPALRPLIDRALGYDKETRIGDCDQMTALVAQAANPPVARYEDTPAQGISQSPDTPAPSKTVARSSAQQPSAQQTSASRASASAAGLPFSRLGAYEILERIGGGGMGDVYKAHDEALDRIVAIKVLPPELARQGDFVRRFRAEAMAIAKLTHPNIVQVFAFGEDAGRHFFAMQFVNGESLAQLLRRRSRLSVDEALPLFQQCLAGLAAAHQRDLIHRDIKPGNILIDREHHRALVADFGLVKTADSGDNLTATGTIMGTVDYISPEQARGQHVDGRSDLYSLGALMYQTLSGRLPFVSDSPTGMIFQHAFEQPKALCEVAPDVPKQVGAIVMRLLAKAPDQRYATAKEVLAAIQAFRAGKKVADPAESEPKSSVVASGMSVVGLPPLLAAPRAAGWSDRLRDLWRAHAPAIVQGPMNTQQQVDGAVEEYERRRNELSALAKEAAAVTAEFAGQAASHRKAAAAAALRAEKASDPSQAARAREEQAKCEQVAADFESQLAEQQEQSEAIQLRLTQVNATLQKLRSQRDVLQARLRAAESRLAAEGARPARPRRIGLIAAAGGLFVLALGAWIIVRDRDGREIARIEAPAGATAELRNSDETPRGPVDRTAPPSAAVPPSLPITASDMALDRQVAEMVLKKGAAFSVATLVKKREKIFVSLNDLPDEPFIVTGLNLKTSLNATELAQIARLKSLGLLAFLFPNPITDEELSHLMGPENLTHFICASPNVTDNGLAVLDRLPNLRKLSLIRTSVLGPGLVHLKSVPKLTDLEIPAPEIPPLCAPLKDLTLLTRLRCGGTQFTDEGLKYIKDLPNLETLQLRSSTITNDGLETIGKMPALKDVELAYTKITDSGLQSLAPLKQLSRLDLSYTVVSDAGLQFLAPLKNLTFLSLSGTRITDDGLDLLQSMKTLTSLHVRATSITKAAVDRFETALPKCKVEWDGGAKAATDEPAAASDRAASEWVIASGGTVRVEINRKETLVTALGDLSPGDFRLRSIDLHGTSVRDAELVHVANLQNLKKIELMNTQTSDAGLAHLRSDENLTFIDLGNTKITDAGLAHLTGLPNLTTLGLLATGTTDAGLDHVSKLVTLTSLNLDHAKITNDGLSRLKTLQRLSFLNLDTVAVSDQGIAHLAELQNLRTLILAKTGLTDAGLAYLEGLAHLEDLNVKGTRVTSEGVAKFHAARLIAGSPLCKLAWDGQANSTTLTLPMPPRPAASSKAITTFNDPAFQAWMKEVADLSAEQQMEAVAKKLQQLNPGFDGVVNPTIDQRTVTALEFFADNVTDISPVRALPGLSSLTCNGSAIGKSKLSDLSPLQGMRLTKLNFECTQVSDLSPLRGMPLTFLHFYQTPVSDLSPLKGMPLTYLNCQSTPVTDLSSIQGMPLTYLCIERTPAFDLSPLKGMPLTRLNCGNSKISDLSPLSGMPLTELVCQNTEVADLSPLKGMPLAVLDCGGTKVSDLSPLSGMKITQVRCFSTKVSDLSPLEECPNLTHVNAKGLKITTGDVAALQRALPNCKVEWDGQASPTTVASKIGPATYSQVVALRKNAGVSLIGRVNFENQDAGLVVKYAAGRILSGESIVTALKKIVPETDPKFKTVVTLYGTLRLPTDTTVAMWHKGGSANGGVHYLMVDNQEVGSVGDDRWKDSYYSLNLPAGDHAVTWRLTGGDLGGTNLIEFVDRKTGHPLELFASPEDIAAAETAPAVEVIDNSSREPEPGFVRPSVNLLVAEWAVSVGGKVRVQAYGKVTPKITTAADLPPEIRTIDVDLSGSKITDADLSRLAQLGELEQLNLQGTPITDAGLRNLDKLPRLTELNLLSTGVTAAGVARLQTALPKCNIQFAP